MQDMLLKQMYRDKCDRAIEVNDRQTGKHVDRQAKPHTPNMLLERLVFVLFLGRETHKQIRVKYRK